MAVLASTELLLASSTVPELCFTPSCFTCKHYAPPLGGPYVAASAAAIDDTTAAEALFQRLSDGKDKLTPIRMSRSLSQLSDGAQGVTWAQFVEGF